MLLALILGGALALGALMALGSLLVAARWFPEDNR